MSKRIYRRYDTCQDRISNFYPPPPYFHLDLKCRCTVLVHQGKTRTQGSYIVKDTPKRTKGTRQLFLPTRSCISGSFLKLFRRHNPGWESADLVKDVTTWQVKVDKRWYVQSYLQRILHEIKETSSNLQQLVETPHTDNMLFWLLVKMNHKV